MTTRKIKKKEGKSSLYSTLLGFFQTIRMRVMVLVIISVITPSLLGGLLAMKYLDSILKEQVYQILSRDTERHSLHLSQFFSNRISDVRAFTSSYLLNEDVSVLLSGGDELTRSRSLVSVNRYLSYLLEDNIPFREFAIFTHDGKQLAGQPDGLVFDRGAEGALESLSTEPKIIDVANGKGSRIIIGQSIPGPSKGQGAFFLGTLGLDLIRKSIMKDLAPHSTAYIIDGSGAFRGITDPDLYDKPIPAAAADLMSMKGKAVQYRDLSDEQVIGTSFPIEHLPWNLVTETPRKYAFLPLASFRRQLIIMTFVLAVILLIPAVLVARTIILPLEDLSRVARKIRAGDAGVQVPITARGELGEFVNTFNRMSSSLKLSMEEVQAINNQLRVMSITDPLTGRYNRRFISDHVHRELKLSQRIGQPASLLMLDLDNFKEYNDSYGHIAGDEALRKLGDVLVDSVRETDVVARYGGEEFLIFLSHTGKSGAVKTAEKLCLAVEQTSFVLKGQDTRITVSIGVATAPEDGSTYEELVDNADKAMYAAKGDGRNQVHVFSEQDQP